MSKGFVCLYGLFMLGWFVYEERRSKGGIGSLPGELEAASAASLSVRNQFKPFAVRLWSTDGRTKRIAPNLYTLLACLNFQQPMKNVKSSASNEENSYS